MDGEIIANKSPIIKDNIMSDQVHEFSFEREGYITRQVQWKFKPWEKRTEVITLTEITFDLEIDSIPQNAWVFLNDKRYGRTPLVIKDLKARKEYQLRLELSFYEPWIMAIQYKGKPVKKVCAYLD
jgi:hypothetical protein